MPSGQSRQPHRRLLGYLRRAGRWPDVLASLEQLMELLQQHPPPIDCQARREHADQVAAFAAAT